MNSNLNMESDEVSDRESLSIVLRNCTFAFKCDRQWEQLKHTSQDGIRFCGECQKEVYFCTDAYELSNAVALNRCVAIVVEDHLAPRVLLGALKPLGWVPPEDRN
jgi:hypothetical protein